MRPIENVTERRSHLLSVVVADISFHDLITDDIILYLELIHY